MDPCVAQGYEVNLQVEIPVLMVKSYLVCSLRQKLNFIACLEINMCLELGDDKVGGGNIHHDAVSKKTKSSEMGIHLILLLGFTGFK